MSTPTTPAASATSKDMLVSDKLTVAEVEHTIDLMVSVGWRREYLEKRRQHARDIARAMKAETTKLRADLDEALAELRSLTSAIVNDSGSSQPLANAIAFLNKHSKDVTG